MRQYCLIYGHSIAIYGCAMRARMKRTPIVIVALMLCMTVAPSMAEIAAPNDNETVNGVHRTLSIDGYVTTKFASVGSDVEIMALTRGHSSNTIVTADILHFRDFDPMDMLTSVSLPGSGVYVDTVVLSQAGVHDDDANTMTWRGTYIIPVDSLGGVYGASITAEDGNLLAMDNPTQSWNIMRGEFEKVMQAVDTAWDIGNPTMEIRNEFFDLDTLGSSHGGWTSFVTTATKGQGSGGSEQLWDDMLSAGHDQYDMSAGANFLEALMDFLDSEDIDASMATIIGLMAYANEFPLPRTFDDFDEVVDYMMTFDPIENFTRYEGTGDFEAAYNALLGSDEWLALEEALNNLADNSKQLESIQTIMHNIALLAVSIHPEAITDAMEAWIMPLMEGDFESMTPVQKLIVRWIEMAEALEETDIHDTNGDEIPDVIIWQYEKLLDTSEGQAWTAKMESSTDSSYVNDVFDDFNTLPEDLLDILVNTMEDPIWGTVGDAAGVFGDWIENASGTDRHMYWPSPSSSEDEEEGEAGTGSGEAPTGSEDDSIIFDELYDVRTTVNDPNVLDLGIEIRFWGPWEDDDYPDHFAMSMTNNHGITVNTLLLQDDDDRGRYLGRLTASHIEDAVWSFTQPLENYEPDCADEGCSVDNAELRMEALRPSMLEASSWEGMDEIFVVSAVGVLVEQDETTSVDAPYTVTALSYDSSGPVEGAEVDIAIVRISPQRAEDALSQFESEGEVELTVSHQLEGRYTGSDLDGDVSATIARYEEDRDGQQHPQTADIEDDIEISGMGTFWAASSELPPEGGLAEVRTTGITETGLEFEFMRVVPLPGTSGCAKTWGGSGGSYANIGWEYRNFRIDGEEDGEYDKPELNEIKIDWGDGEYWSHTNSEQDHREDGWEGHDYEEDWENANEYHITVIYTDEDDDDTEHHFTYKPHHGYSKHSDEGEQYYEDSDEEGGWCELHSDESFTPSPQIIDGFITDGPLEVMDEQILTSGSDGEVGMTVTPTLPGAYISIVQSKVTRDDGETMTGVGLNFVAVTEASISLGGGLTQETTIAGIPVYTVEPDGGGLTTISVTPSGVDADEYTAWLGVAPVDLSVPFPDIDESVWSEPVDFELNFQQGDTSRNQEVRITAPVSLVAVMIMEEGSLFPTAIHAGLLLNNPGTMEMTGTLGPGQTTNIALSEEDGVASRILAMAAPKEGLDPASLDLSAFTEILYQELARGAIGWIPAEKELEQTCERFEGWREDRWDDGQESNIRMNVEYDFNEYAYSGPAYNPSNIVLADSDGNEVTPTSDWSMEEWEDKYHANFNLDSGQYTLTAVNGEIEFDITAEEEGGQFEWGSDNEMCSGNAEMTETEIYDMFDEFFGDLESVAWGQGSSADLRLPILSAPQEDYTVIAVAQIGQGESASVVAALDTKVAEPNPEPPVLQNLTLSFSPSNPLPGDAVQITAVNENNQPVSGLSVTLVRDNVTLYGLVTDDDGQAAFWVTVGTIVVRVSGGECGCYNPAELTIIVTEQGIVTDDGEELPADNDGDGVLNSDDEFPDDPNEAVDTDGDGVGDNADAFPDDPDEDTDSDGDGIGDNSETSGEGGAATSTSMDSILLIAGAVVGVLILITTIALFAMRRRNRDDDMWSEGQEEDVGDVMFNAPDGPPPGQSGEMRDGYEILEYPSGSGEWWWRDPSSGKWMEWQN